MRPPASSGHRRRGRCPAPAPTRLGTDSGYTSWQHRSQDLEQSVLCFVPLDEPVKIIRLRITNRGSAPRRVSVFFYAEWVLGALRANAAASVVTRSAEDGDVVLAENPASADFIRLVAFAAADGPGNEGRHFSADRTAFLGRYGSAEAPEGVASRKHSTDAVAPASTRAPRSSGPRPSHPAPPANGFFCSVSPTVATRRSRSFARSGRAGRSGPRSRRSAPSGAISCPPCRSRRPRRHWTCW